MNREACDRAAPGVPLDVTIDDDTEFTPGAAFTKIWRLRNTGTCTWSTEYRLAFFSGHAMGAPLVVHLHDSVAPGDAVDLAVDMVSPMVGGRYQGNWKLQNANSEWFGIGPMGDLPFWVRIQVIAPPTPTDTATPTPSVTPTPLPTPTLTPDPVEPVTVLLAPNDLLDLDNRRLAQESGEEDLRFESVEIGGLPGWQLAPLLGTQLGWFGADPPSQADCSATPLAASPLVVDAAQVGGTLCYVTPKGTQGWARISGFNPVGNILTVQLLNWPPNP